MDPRSGAAQPMHRAPLKTRFCWLLVPFFSGCSLLSGRGEWQPTFTTQSVHFAGESVSGARAQLPDLSDWTDALELRIELYVGREFTGGGLKKLSQAVELHVSDGGEPIRIVDDISSYAVVGRGTEAHAYRAALQARGSEEFLVAGELATVLPMGVTAGLEFATGAQEFSVEVSRDAHGERASLIAFSESGSVRTRHVSVLPAINKEVDLPLLIAAPLADGECAVWWIELFDAPLDPHGAPDHRERFAQCKKAVEASSLAISNSIEPLESRLLEIRRLSGAIDALEIVRLHRPALIFLASQSGAPTAMDVAWLADDEFLSACVERVLGELRNLETLRGRTQTAWHLERSCYRELATRYADEQLPDELISVLFRHAGELGRYPGLLDDLLIESANQDELDDRMAHENFLFLEARSPAARVRALDWLEARGLAPEGYEPLAPREERRAALRRAEESE